MGRLLPRHVARAQAAYLVLNGLWPIVSPGSFQRVTGPKPELWNAQALGGLMMASGASLARDAGRAGEPGPRTLGIGTALALGTADVVFAGRRRISPVFLLDAAVEALFAAAWLRAGRQR
jgi:hypothetical protein